MKFSHVSELKYHVGKTCFLPPRGSRRLEPERDQFGDAVLVIERYLSGHNCLFPPFDVSRVDKEGENAICAEEQITLSVTSHSGEKSYTLQHAQQSPIFFPHSHSRNAEIIQSHAELWVSGQSLLHSFVQAKQNSPSSYKNISKKIIVRLLQARPPRVGRLLFGQAGVPSSAGGGGGRRGRRGQGRGRRRRGGRDRHR